VTRGQAWDSSHWVDNTENGPEYQALYEELLETFEEGKQEELVFEMVRLFEEESPWISLWTQPALSGASNRTDWEDFGQGNLLFMWPNESEPVHYTG
jgi:ABC-type transport system substrate-binding protein